MLNNDYSKKIYSNVDDRVNAVSRPKSPSTKSFSYAYGPTGNALLSRPSYQAGKDTWVTEYKYKDADVNVIIKQKVKILSHNNEIRSNYFVQNEVINVDRFKIKDSEKESSESGLTNQSLADLVDSDTAGVLNEVKKQMLSNPSETMKAQAGQTAAGVMALIM